MIKRLLGHKLSYLKAVLSYYFSFGFITAEKEFEFLGKSLKYFHHRYNLTWLNERRVEIPVALEFLNSSAGKTLEIGNVMPHYFPLSHPVIDKYESGTAGILNIDVLDYEPEEKYDTILSISTFEHVGQDENEDPAKAITAILHLKTLLTEHGQLLITFPLGYNSALDGWIFKESFFTRVTFLKRINWSNDWKSVPPEEAHGAKFDSPFPLGNTIAICLLKKS